MEKMEASNVQFETKTITPEVVDVSSEESIKITPVTLDAKSNTYVSPEVKKSQQFKFYNNTYMYVTFREEFV